MKKMVSMLLVMMVMILSCIICQAETIIDIKEVDKEYFSKEMMTDKMEEYLLKEHCVLLIDLSCVDEVLGYTRQIVVLSANDNKDINYNEGRGVQYNEKNEIEYEPDIVNFNETIELSKDMTGRQIAEQMIRFLTNDENYDETILSVDFKYCVLDE